jgi:hypothetical protein
MTALPGFALRGAVVRNEALEAGENTMFSLPPRTRLYAALCCFALMGLEFTRFDGDPNYAGEPITWQKQPGGGSEAAAGDGN